MADRKLGFGVTEGGIGYELAFAAAKHAGIQFIELPQQWDDIESSPGDYASEFIAMADEVYPALGTSIVLSLNPIDTTTLRVPKHLRDKSWQSDQRIESYCNWVDWTIAQLPNATIEAISVGNEVDVWLSTHPDQIDDYAIFFAAVAKHIHANHPGIPVGVKMTYDGRNGDQSNDLTSIDLPADVCMLTYYPLDQTFRVRPPETIRRDFDAMVKIAGGKPIHLLETGYPSGEICGSSPARQAKYIDQLFEAWDMHIDHFRLINLVWTHDLSAADAESLTTYYNTDQPAFTAYLSTLGLHDHHGTPKPAWHRIRKNVRQRAQKSKEMASSESRQDSRPPDD